MSKTTASTPSTKVSNGQVGKLFDQLRSGILKSDITGETFQRMLIQENRLLIRSRVVALLEQIASKVASVFISVNHDKENAIQAVIDDNGFDKVIKDVDVKDIPRSGSGEAQNEVFEFRVGRKIRAYDLHDELDEHDFVFADPLTALHYAQKFPDCQRKYPLAILFRDKQGELCSLTLGGGVSWRHLWLLRPDRGSSYLAPYRFLVVRKAVKP